MLCTDKEDTNSLEMLTHPHPWASSKKKKKQQKLWSKDACIDLLAGVTC